MGAIYTIDNFPASLHGSALAIGKFDGVHRGHQALIKATCDIDGVSSRGALTFSPHLSLFLCPDKPVFVLNTDEQKARLLFALGLDFLIVQPLSWDFLHLSYQDFIDSILIKKLGISHVIVGRDFSFGSNAKGTVKHLEIAANGNAFKLHLIDDIYINGTRCSSSAIRIFLEHGDLKSAEAMLGRPYSLFGRVSSGQGLGAPLGFATANIKPPPGFGLKKGIYATITRAYLPQGPKDFLSATSVGTRPTVTDSTEIVVETHCLDENLDLLGCDLEIFFIERLRDEQKFDTLSELKAQVSLDFTHTRQLAKDHPGRFGLQHLLP
jgi:riboflavin kinase/FMN adenylyltransferase